MPNLITDRGVWVAGSISDGNVRRLMYQSLIWSFDLRNDAGGLGAPLNPESRKGLADALIDGVGRDVELGRNLFGGKVLVDKKQAIELTSG